MFRREAIEKAYEYNLDLYCVAPNNKPPVCKILDYGKFRFESQKKAKENKKRQHVSEIKSLRLSFVIDTHDFDTKVKQARKFLEAGNKVKLDMRFKGRMITKLEIGKEVMNKFIEGLSEVGASEKAPNLDGNTLSVVISPIKKKK